MYSFFIVHKLLKVIFILFNCVNRKFNFCFVLFEQVSKNINNRKCKAGFGMKHVFFHDLMIKLSILEENLQ